MEGWTSQRVLLWAQPGPQQSDSLSSHQPVWLFQPQESLAGEAEQHMVCEAPLNMICVAPLKFTRAEHLLVRDRQPP